MSIFRKAVAKTPATGSVMKRKAILESESVARRRKRLLDSMDETDAKFSNPDDTPLTEEQRKEVGAFWSKYSYSMRPPYMAVQTSMNRTGVFDPKCMPYIFRKLNPDALTPPRYKFPWQNKAYLPRVFPEARQPKTLVRLLDGIFLDTDFKHISIEDAAKICSDHMADGSEIVWKSNSSPGEGKTVKFFSGMDYDAMLDKFKKTKISTTVQESIKQHPFMNQLNTTTINTMRLTTVRLGDRIVPVAALIKVGGPNARVDNYVQGGCMFGVNPETGRANDWALDKKHNRIKVLPSGFEIGDGFDVPYFNEIVDMAIRCHYTIPNIGMIGWDIAIAEDGPVLIEENFASDIRIHQAVGGSVFGKYTEEFLDIYYVQKYAVPQCEGDYSYGEFIDHVEILRYFGHADNVNIPAEIGGKPVTKIGSKCFKLTHNVKGVVLPKSTKHIGLRYVKPELRGKTLTVDSTGRVITTEE